MTDFEYSFNIMCGEYGPHYRTLGTSILDVVKEYTNNGDIEWILSHIVPAIDLDKLSRNINYSVRNFIYNNQITDQFRDEFRKQREYSSILHKIYYDSIAMEFVLYDRFKNLTEQLLNKYKDKLSGRAFVPIVRERNLFQSSANVNSIFGSYVGEHISLLLFNCICEDTNSKLNLNIIKQAAYEVIDEYSCFLDDSYKTMLKCKLVMNMRLFYKLLGIDALMIGLQYKFDNEDLWPYTDNLDETIYKYLNNNKLSNNALYKAKLLGLNKVGDLSFNELILLEMARRSLERII